MIMTTLAATCTKAPSPQYPHGEEYPSARLEDLHELIEVLDLDPIKVKLMDPEEGEGWSREQADHADRMYRRFLFLTAKYPSHTIVPNKLVDHVWHTHILDTMKYAQDCDRIFGHFLHHFPYFGMRGDDDADDLREAFAASNKLQLDEFGPSQIAADEGASICNSPNCWGGSCGAKCNVTAEELRPQLAEPTGRVRLYDTAPDHRQ
jgi:hypothetical protein